jgi:integrase/recombinase XerD
MKKDRFGQAHPIDKDDYLKIRKHFNLTHHQLIWDIAYYTGERAGAILQLEVSDVFEDWNKFKVRRAIIFKGRTRKDGKTREVPMHKDLRAILASQKINRTGYLFKSPVDENKHFTLRAYDAVLKRAVDRASLSNKGISTHSTRRGFITNLHKKGVSLRTIQAVMGYASLSMLSRYVDVDEDTKAEAVGLLD